MIGRNELCFCGSGKKWKKCHALQESFAAPSDIRSQYASKYGILIKTKEQIQGIRNACKLAAQILKKVSLYAKAGITTNQLNALAEQLHQKAGAKAAPLGYGHPPFPKSICTSKNEVICHGIPDDIPLVDGDILNIDVTCELNGYFGDCSSMVAIGQISAEKQTVIDVSYQCLQRAISILKPGMLIHEIGKTIEDYATSQGCSVVHQFVGHGTGLFFHESPNIPHHYNHLNIPLVEGMTFTIEPMINAGKSEAIIDQKDQWTARTLDGKASAQWEHTLLITASGYEILTID
ncbi:MAG: methionyl aminopeptidase [Chlamydiae bacterium]|nr:methionyl aminopeptidase [Chlamydiota bacterium]